MQRDIRLIHTIDYNMPHLKDMLGAPSHMSKRDIKTWINNAYKRNSQDNVNTYENYKNNIEFVTEIYRLLQKSYRSMNKVNMLFDYISPIMQSRIMNTFSKDLHYIERLFDSFIQRYTKHNIKKFSFERNQKNKHIEVIKNLKVLPHGPDTNVPITYRGSREYWNAFRNSVLLPSDENETRAKKLVKEAKKRHRQTTSQFIDDYENYERGGHRESI